MPCAESCWINIFRQLLLTFCFRGFSNWYPGTDCHYVTSPKVTPQGHKLVRQNQERGHGSPWLQMSSFNHCTHCHPHGGGGGGVAGGGGGRDGEEWNRKASKTTNIVRTHSLWRELTLWIHTVPHARCSQMEKGRGFGVFPCLEKNTSRHPLMQKHGFYYRDPAPLLGDFLTFLRFHRSVSVKHSKYSWETS